MTERAGGAGAARSFLKMSGSGNDFIVFDARAGIDARLDAPEVLRRLCARGTGVGADGVVFIERDPAALFRMRYHNADGSRAELCGNAALCSTRLAVELGMASGKDDFEFETDSGRVRGRIRDGQPEIDLAPVNKVRATVSDIQAERGERRLGFALVGVPHVVVMVADAEQADVGGRGRELRHHPSLEAGANANFVSRLGSAWRYRTFERGVEAETLACGTGAVATAILLTEWGEAGSGPIELRTSSGETLTVRLTKQDNGWWPALSGPAAIVFEGSLREG